MSIFKLFTTWNNFYIIWLAFSVVMIMVPVAFIIYRVVKNTANPFSTFKEFMQADYYFQGLTFSNIHFLLLQLHWHASLPILV